MPYSYADLHLHTCHSDGQPRPEDLVDFAIERTALDLIAITDHDTVEGALRAADYLASLGGRQARPLTVVVGEEVTSRDGHILGLFLERSIPPGMSARDTVEAIHAQAGLAVAAHPFWRTVRQSGVSGPTSGIGWTAAEVAFDAIEVENATPGLYLFNQMAHRLQEDTGRPALGSSDAHILDAIGRAYTRFPGQGAADLRRAIEQGQTSAHRLRYRPRGLVRYAAWGWELRRQRRAAGGSVT